MSAPAAAKTYSFLTQIPLFQGLAPEDLKRLCAMTKEVRFQAGELIFEEGSPGDFAYVIKEGQIEISRYSDGRRVPLARRGTGEVIGEMALLEEAPRMASARALTDCVLVAIGREELDQLLGSSPSAARAILGTVMTRLRETQAALRQSEKMAQLGILSAGIAHELNNPAAAVLRGARQLEAAVEELRAGPASVAGLRLSGPQMEELKRLLEEGSRPNRPAVEASPLERSDRQDALERWLDGHGVAGAERLAGELAEMGYGPEGLEELARLYSPHQLEELLPLISAAHRAGCLLEEISLGAGEIASIVKALKSYVYLDQAPVQEVDVHEGLENTLIILRHKLKAGIAVRKDFDPALPRIEAHGGELNQVWTNLIDNAAYSLRAQGEIVLRTRRDGDWIVVEVQDNGPGIPEQLQSKVFALFFTTKPLGQGTGQGLNISYNIVRRHGGSIDFRSKPGSTVFTVRLPLKLPQVADGEGAR
jgi:signal transduction histidine kinase